MSGIMDRGSHKSIKKAGILRSNLKGAKLANNGSTRSTKLA
jgi:hypothetical protein